MTKRLLGEYKASVATVEALKVGDELRHLALGLVDTQSFDLLKATPQVIQWLGGSLGTVLNLSRTIPSFNIEQAKAALALEGGCYQLDVELSPIPTERVSVRICIFSTREPHSENVNFYAFDISDFKKKEAIFKSVSTVLDANRLSLADSHKNLETILNLLPQAFFTVDSELKVLEGYSAKVTEILSPQPAGHKLSDIAENFTGICELISMLFAGIPLAAVTLLLPPQLRHNGRLITVSLIPIVEDNALAKVMVAISDITQQSQMQLAVDRQNSQAKAVMAILSAREDFLDLLDSVKELREKLDDEEAFRRLTHGLKGGFGFFDCHEFISLCHEAESEWKEVGYDPSLGESFVEALSGAVDEFVSLHQDVLQMQGYTLGEKARLPVKVEFETLQTLYQTAKEEGAPETVLVQIEKLAELPASSLLAWLDRAWIQALDSMGKQGGALQWNGDIRLAREPYKDLFKTFVHIMRNAADHGIEEPAVRLRREKPVTGIMQVDAHYEDGMYRLTFRDDGCGIDTERVREIAQARGLPTATLSSSEEILSLLCTERFSSKEEITTLSGRGIGLYAVRQEARRLGGDVIIRTSVGHYTEVEVSFRHQSMFAR